MNIEELNDELMEAGWPVRLDEGGELRIDPDAGPRIRQLVRDHRQMLIDYFNAGNLMNDAKTHMVHLPDGRPALAYRPGTDLERIR